MLPTLLYLVLSSYREESGAIAPPQNPLTEIRSPQPPKPDRPPLHIDRAEMTPDTTVCTSLVVQLLKQTIG
jgi:hypothetical protein